VTEIGGQKWIAEKNLARTKLGFSHLNRVYDIKASRSFSINNTVSLSDMQSGWDPTNVIQLQVGQSGCRQLQLYSFSSEVPRVGLRASRAVGGAPFPGRGRPSDGC